MRNPFLWTLNRLRHQHQPPAPDPAIVRIEGLLNEIAGHLAALREEARAADPSTARVESLLSEINNHLIYLRLRGVRLEPNVLFSLLFARLTSEGDDSDPKSLRRHHGQIYSQNGEDGIIAEIFHRIGGPQNRVFIEIGIENGLQNNTRFLLEQGWRGLWVEGSATSVQAAAGTFARYIEGGQLQIVHCMTTPENINKIVGCAGLPPEIDFLSVDIDQYTHFVWEALTAKARVHCVEYNGSIPPSLDLCVPYDPAIAWDGTNFFGAGLKTLERIGRLKGLNLVGCDLAGVNAFFVDAALCGDHFREPFTAEAHYELPKYGSYAVIGHPPSVEARHWSVL
jgi:hypothetical protein